MSVSISPLPKLQFSQGGIPVAGGKVFTYQAGTTTKLATFTNSTGVTPNTNPIILDSQGQCDMWLTVGSAYKIVLSPSTDTDPPTNAFWTEDNISGNSPSSFVGDIANTSDMTKGVSLVGGASRTISTISILRTLPKTGSPEVFVTGYYAQGDGGGGPYYFDSTDTTTADNGGSVIVASDGGRWKLASTTAWSVKQFGAKGDGSTDDTSTIQAAINAMASGKKLIFPQSTYRITSAITTPTGAIVYLEGFGAGATIIRQDGAAANGIVFNISQSQGGGVRGMTIKANSATGTGSTGTGLIINQANDNFVVERVDISNFGSSLTIAGCFNIWVSEFRLLFFQNFGLTVTDFGGTAGAGLQATHGKISNLGFTGTNTASIGIFSVASGGDFFTNIDVTSCNNPILIQPKTGFNVLYNFFTNVLADSAVGDSWTLDSTNGKLWSFHATNCWSAFSTNGIGLASIGTQTQDVQFVNSRFRENGKQGIYLGTGGIRFSSCSVASNSKLTANTYDGVFVDVNANDWSFVDCKIGNYASGLTGHANNIFIQAGAQQNFQILGCDLRSPGSGFVPLSLGTSSVNYFIRDNLPQQTSGVNKSSSEGLSVTSAGTLAAGVSRYLGAGGQFVNVTDSPFVVIKPGLVSSILVQVIAAPGAGQSFTYTLYKNGSATALTGSISGAASTQVFITNSPVTVSSSDVITLLAVTSAGAAVTGHRAAIQLEE